MNFNHLAIVVALAATSTTVESLSIRGIFRRDAANEKMIVDDLTAAYTEERVLSNVAAYAEEEGGVRRDLQWISNCGTVAYWHPVYSAGWENGYCSQTIGCNAPSYVTVAECCGAAYLGQSTGACNAAAGITPTPPPAPTSPSSPSSGGAMWYPDYNVDWSVGKCIDTLPLPPYGSRPLYTTQLACCKAAYAGQTNTYCIQNLANPPTMKPTPAPTSKPTGTPTTSTPTAVPTSKPTSTPTVAPTAGPTAVPTTSTPTAAPTTSTPTEAPTAGPTAAPTTSTPTAAPTTSTPTAAPTTSTPTEAPTRKPTGEPTVAPTRKPTEEPTTREPTVTQYGSLWYPNYNTGTCSNKLPLPVNGAAPISDSKATCCLGTYGSWSTAKVASCLDG